MSVVGRLCCQFQVLLRSGSSGKLSALQPDQCLIWNQSKRFYTRKANLQKKLKKAQERALKKQARSHIRIAKVTTKPFPTDKSADKEPSTDDVWFSHMHPIKQVTFEEAVNFHRETLHETVLNHPEAYLNFTIVLNLQTKKEGVLLDKVKGLFMPIHFYPSGRDVRVLALCKEPEDVEKAKEAGAFSAGGLKFIKSIEEGNLQVEEYDTVVAHTDVLPYLTPIRGLLKTKFPRVSQGTMGKDMAKLIVKVRESRPYNLMRNAENSKTGWVDDIIGTLNMPLEHLEANMNVYLSGILHQQPKAWDTPFISALYVRTPSSDEVFLLNRSSVLKEEINMVKGKQEIVQSILKKDADEDEEDEEEEEEEGGEIEEAAKN